MSDTLSLSVAITVKPSNRSRTLRSSVSQLHPVCLSHRTSKEYSCRGLVILHGVEHAKVVQQHKLRAEALLLDMR